MSRLTRGSITLFDREVGTTTRKASRDAYGGRRENFTSEILFIIHNLSLMSILTRTQQLVIGLVAVFLFAIPFTFAHTATPITIDTGAYTGKWIIVGQTSAVTGNQVVNLNPGTYTLQVGLLSPGTFQLTVDNLGNVTSLNPGAAVGSGNTLTFNTAIVSIDSGGFVAPSSWSIEGVTGAFAGNHSVAVVPNLGYFLKIGLSNPGAFQFNVDTADNVTSLNTAAATGSGNTLTFNTVTISIDTGEFVAPGLWFVLGASNSQSGDHSVIVVPNVGYLMGISSTNSGAFFQFNVNAAGNVISLNSVSATGSGDTLTFNTELIEIAPEAAKVWSIVSAKSNSTIAGAIHLVSGIKYFLQDNLGNTTLFTVGSSPCSVTPSSITLPGNTFTLNCSTPDTDGDGVLDTVDNCPAIANPDQVDQDLDGIGNECDPDLDGDGALNTADNCPLIANADQADLDGDGIGDLCDGDVDGDSVADNFDNCPFIANTDQADNDGDGFGDQCDNDDDNDTVLDTADNCPFTANLDQIDSDGDGLATHATTMPTVMVS